MIEDDDGPPTVWVCQGRPLCDRQGSTKAESHALQIAAMRAGCQLCRRIIQHSATREEVIEPGHV